MGPALFSDYDWFRFGSGANFQRRFPMRIRVAQRAFVSFLRRILYEK